MPVYELPTYTLTAWIEPATCNNIVSRQGAITVSMPHNPHFTNTGSGWCTGGHNTPAYTPMAQKRRAEAAVIARNMPQIVVTSTGTEIT